MNKQEGYWLYWLLVAWGIEQSRQADIKFSTITGTIYSNHELALIKKRGGVPSVIKDKIV